MNQPANSDRVSIWSVRADDLKLYSVAFPLVTVLGSIYYRIFVTDWQMSGWIAGIGELLRDIGLMGVSGAVISLLLVVGRRIVMVLFDWPSKRERNMRKARKQGREEREEEIVRKLREQGVDVVVLEDGEIRVVSETKE